MTKTQNIENQVVGDDITLNVTVRDTSGQLIDVSSVTSVLTVKDNYDGNILSQVNGTLITDGSDGKLEFNIPNTATVNALAGKEYVYDIAIILSNNRKYTITRGGIKFVADV